MTGKDTPDLNDDALAREVDKLLRKLPGADPYLRGDPEPAVVRPARGAAAPSRTPLPRARPSGPGRVQRIAVWVRVGLGVLLGALITQWPYENACGWGLGVFLGSIGAIVMAGVWAGVWSWRYLMGLAHSASLLVVCWGVALGAHEVLQRNGYAATAQSWQCVTR